jgi:hypothetical protein
MNINILSALGTFHIIRVELTALAFLVYTFSGLKSVATILVEATPLLQLWPLLSPRH